LASSRLEIGVITLGEFLSDARLGQKISARQRVHEIVDAARLADEAGLEVFGVGEHHSLDFVVLAGWGCLPVNGPCATAGYPAPKSRM